MSASKIGRFTISRNKISEYSTPSADAHPSGIVAGPKKTLWFVEWNTGNLGQITTKGLITELPVPGGGNPTRITYSTGRELWFSDQYGNWVGGLTRKGTRTFKAPTRGAQPFGIAVGPDGAIWYCEYAANKIARLLP